MKKTKRVAPRRTIAQILATLLTNANLAGFVEKRIYDGPIKIACVPGLNCYSCPGAVGSCPIGALQSVIGSRKYGFSFYVVGFLLLIGVMLGRLVCGFLCPFGFVQELLHKIPSRKYTLPRAIDKPARYTKYLILLVLVLALPMFLVNAYGVGAPYFCKLLCPVGTLEGGLFLTATDPALAAQTGFLFDWKLGVLIAVVLSAVFVYRPFCKYMCPLGAIYALFNRVSAFSMRVEEDKCVHCGACERACKMQVDVTKHINGAECIRCGACKDACPVDAIRMGFHAHSTVQKPREFVG